MLEDIVGHFETTSFVIARINQRKGNVLDDTEIWNKVEALENEADFFGAETSLFASGDTVDGLAAKLVFARSGFIEKANDVKQGGLTTTGRSHNHNEFAAFNGEVKIVQSVRFGVAYSVAFRDRFKLDDGFIFLIRHN